MCHTGLQTSLQYPVEVINFTDEEGRFGGMFGSQALTGQVTPASLAALYSVDGTCAATALDSLIGPGASQSVHTAAYEPGSIRAYVELHIEQGMLDHPCDRARYARITSH